MGRGERWKSIAIGVVAGAGVVLLFELVDLGRRLSGRSDTVWWQLLPWALLVVFWAVLIIQMRRKRTRDQESSE